MEYPVAHRASGYAGMIASGELVLGFLGTNANHEASQGCMRTGRVMYIPLPWMGNSPQKRGTCMLFVPEKFLFLSFFFQKTMITSVPSVASVCQASCIHRFQEIL